MIRNKRDVIAYLEQKKFWPSFKIIGVKSGLSNSNYIIETSVGKYIFRTNKIKPSKSTNCLSEEANVLKFLAKQEIDFVPRTFYFDKEKNIHILNYIEGRKVRFKNISPKGMKQAVEKLYEINFLAKSYQEFCQQEGILLSDPKSEIERTRGRILDKLKLIEPDNIFYDIKKIIENILQEDFSDELIEKEKFYLNHGDPADNIIVREGKIYIIDWEYVRLTYGPGLVHILAHGGLAPEKEKRLLEYYAYISGEDIDFLRRKTYQEKNIYYLLKIIKLCFSQEDNNLLSSKEIVRRRSDIEKILNRYLEIKNRYLK